MLYGVTLIFFAVTFLVTLFAPGAVPEKEQNVLMATIFALSITTVVLLGMCICEDPSLIGS